MLTNQKEVYLWGSNREGQLGQEQESCPNYSGKPIKVVLHEFMNSSNRERFIGVRAKANYTVLICEGTKNVSRDIDTDIFCDTLLYLLYIFVFLLCRYTCQIN